jgi:integrase/recombinase XerC/integrase/recombinase XerD
LNGEAADWLDHLSRVRKLSGATIRSYSRDLSAWFSYLGERGVPASDAGAAEARGWLTRMSSERLAPATVNRRLSALKGFHDWLIRRGDREINPFASTRSVKGGKGLPGYLTYDEIEKFLELTGSGFVGLRDRVLFELLYSTGCRVGELCSLNIDDVGRREILVRGKGDKERWVFVGRRAAAALVEYLPMRGHRWTDQDGEKALILDLRGRRLTPRGVYYLIRRYAVKTGLTKKVSPHTFRHSFATQLLDEGADIRLVQELLGHASLSTTQVYTHTGIERIKRVYRQSHPHGRIKMAARGRTDA